LIRRQVMAGRPESSAPGSGRSASGRSASGRSASGRSASGRSGFGRSGSSFELADPVRPGSASSGRCPPPWRGWRSGRRPEPGGADAGSCCSAKGLEFPGLLPGGFWGLRAGEWEPPGEQRGRKVGSLPALPGLMGVVSWLYLLSCTGVCEGGERSGGASVLRGGKGRGGAGTRASTQGAGRPQLQRRQSERHTRRWRGPTGTGAVVRRRLVMGPV